jgi:PAS domain S-box-containing protein
VGEDPISVPFREGCILRLVNFELTEQIRNLQQGDHLCLLYEKDASEQMPALIPFIQDGLSNDEQFIYIADDQTIDALSARLTASGIDVGAESARGRLKLWTRKEWRQPGELDSEKKRLQVQQFADDASAAGFKGIRFAVEMTWTLGPAISAPLLEHWEATINTVFVPGFPGRIICQYNASRLSPEVMLAALHTHPLAIIGEEVYPNFFYQAPLILNGNGNGHQSAAAKVEWMVAQLKRARIAEKHRLQLAQQSADLQQAEVDRQRLEHVEQELRRRNDELTTLIEAKHLLAAIVECSDDAIVSKELDGTITTWNKGAERLFGYRPEEVIGKPITILIPSERHNEEPEIIERIRRGERVDHYETVRVRKDGTTVDVSVTISPMRSHDDRIIGASKVARDITHRKRAGEVLERLVSERTASLREAIAQMEEFSYSVSHDLRAPLRAINAYASALIEDYGPQLDDTARGCLDKIQRSSQRMDKLTQDVLTYSRVARSAMPSTEIDLDKLVLDVIGQYAAAGQNAPAIEIERPLLKVRGHEPSLGQCIANLLTNAIKFVPSGTQPAIRIWTEGLDGNVRLWIEDNGIGIKPEHHERVFLMFERIHPPGKFEGNGIGLTIVRKSIEKMGGRVGVQSDGQHGSRFWLELPAWPL